jgi:hypothetical protein
MDERQVPATKKSIRQHNAAQRPVKPNVGYVAQLACGPER